jgi:hypothetical protein
MNFYQYFIVLGSKFFYIFELKNIRWSVFLIYIALADPEAIADGLNPLTISHTARTISFEAIGRQKKISKDSVMEPNIINKLTASHNGTPIRPQTDKNRGMSFDWYNK